MFYTLIWWSKQHKYFCISLKGSCLVHYGWVFYYYIEYLKDEDSSKMNKIIPSHKINKTRSARVSCSLRRMYHQIKGSLTLLRRCLPFQSRMTVIDSINLRSQNLITREPVIILRISRRRINSSVRIHRVVIVMRNIMHPTKVISICKWVSRALKT